MGAFDEAASSYDDDFSNTVIGQAQRHRVWSYLDNYILKDRALHILELNCGTGVDALYFAEKGHHVLATDQSIEMLKVVQKKVERNKISARVTTATLDFNEVSAALPDLLGANKTFDLIFSNFGGLNCIDKEGLKHLFQKLRPLMSEQGEVVVVTMPKFCWGDFLYRLIKLDFASIKKRCGLGYEEVSVGDRLIPTFFFRPKQVSQSLHGLKYRGGVSTGIWPSYLENKVSQSSFLRVLEKGFMKLTSRWPISWQGGDHILMHFEAVNDDSQSISRK